MWQDPSFWKSMVKLVSQDYVGLLEVQYVGFNSDVFFNSRTGRVSILVHETYKSV